MERFKKFIKKEAVFVISAIVALISCFVIKPDIQYIGYINFSVLGLLFALMTVVAGFNRLSVFRRIAEIMVLKTNSLRVLTVVLWGICFFSAMIITNDVALITFVPLAITVLTMVNANEYIIPIVALQTVAANLGSMATPMGNPQNLFLYDKFNIPLPIFFKVTMPFTLLSFILLFISGMVCVKNKKITVSLDENSVSLSNKKGLIIYSVLGIICIMSVLKILDYKIAVVAAVLSVIFCDRTLIKNIDWFLLLTFVMFFVFVGNLARIQSISDFLSKIIQGREVLSSILLSQVISNVPCAAMLSGFTQNGTALIIGTNLGGLGTLVASLASLISFRLYTSSQNANKLKYVFTFTIINIIFLLILYAIYGIINTYVL